jgi:hypothetical protein
MVLLIGEHMAFYTSVNRYGNSILYRGYSDNGSSIAQKYKFEPSLYIESKDPSKYRSFFGKQLKPIKLASMRDAKEFVEKYDGVSHRWKLNWLKLFTKEGAILRRVFRFNV